ncbi:exported hypothetical protein [Mesorhizobium sp. ORS 3324]|nr:exported hypothetical protein [Mesorhizobium sp. ORS 3324]
MTRRKPTRRSAISAGQRRMASPSAAAFSAATRSGALSSAPAAAASSYRRAEKSAEFIDMNELISAFPIRLRADEAALRVQHEYRLRSTTSSFSRPSLSLVELPTFSSTF